MKRALWIAAPLMLAALAACGDKEKNVTTATLEKDGVKATVEIRDAWCRPTPNGAQVGACYATIKASTANRLTGAATPHATEVQIHDMSMEGGVMKMNALPTGLPLAADEEVRLEPGGKHLMLMGLTGPLAEGSAVALTFTFSGTPAMTVQAPVRQPKA